MIKIDQKYRTLFSSFLGFESNQVTLFWKGRVGFYGLLKAFGVEKGDEVIIPAFTCVVVSNAIIYCGAKPIYAEVDPQTFNIDVSKLAGKITSNTRIIVAQNTFGLSADLAPIIALAKKNQIRVIEDCTHGFGGFYQGQPNGTLSEAAFFSTQWNKPYSTGIGGLVVCRDKELAKRMADWEADLPKPSLLKGASLKFQLFLRKYIMHPALYWLLLKWYRILTHRRIISGSSEGEELDSTKMPKGYLLGMSRVQMRAGVKALKKWPVNKTHRKRIANLYAACLKDLGLKPPFQPAYAEHTFLKYPLLVKDRSRFFAKAIEEKIPLGDWMLSPIHPIQEGFEKWDYHYGENPQAEYLSKHVVNLQTDLGISEALAKRTCDFLKKYQDQLIR